MKPITIKVGEGCGDIMWHLYDFGQEVQRRVKEKPLMTPSIRRTLDGYFHREFSKDAIHWVAYAYNTSKGTTVTAGVK